MAHRPIIASRKLVAIDQNAREFELTIAVGEPYEISDSEWACSVSMDGLYERLHDMHGVDSWQALQLAHQLIAQLLDGFIRDGGRLFWLEEYEPVTMDDLFTRRVTRD